MSSTFVLPPLPYPLTALAPHMSEDTLRTHHGKHHAAYIEKTNKLVKAAGLAPLSLEDVIADARKRGDKALFNNAAQAWNHAFFWPCMAPDGSRQPGAALSEALTQSFGSPERFRKAATEEGAAHFGSGWVWLTADANGALKLESRHDADTPIGNGATPLLTIDVWEHAYYLDHKNERPKFLETFFDALIDWRFADAQFDAACGRAAPWKFPEAQKHAA